MNLLKAVCWKQSFMCLFFWIVPLLTSGFALWTLGSSLCRRFGYVVSWLPVLFWKPRLTSLVCPHLVWLAFVALIVTTCSPFTSCAYIVGVFVCPLPLHLVPCNSGPVLFSLWRTTVVENIPLNCFIFVTSLTVVEHCIIKFQETKLDILKTPSLALCLRPPTKADALFDLPRVLRVAWTNRSQMADPATPGHLFATLGCLPFP